MITFYVATALPAGPGHPLATTHSSASLAASRYRPG
jgi:hypothetical protein